MPDSFDIVIVGSGFAGIGMAIQLEQAGRHDFVILEKADDLGGTWRDNTYPGCACDVPSYLYSFSFAQNPRWSRMFSRQPEIYEYLEDCAARFDVLPHLRYGSAVTGAAYDGATGRWDVEVNGERSVSCRVLVSAVGALHLPNLPTFPGLETFSGTTFHSAHWRHDEDLTGRRVAIIGTGASAVQLLPEVAKQAAHVDVFQRTPAWVVPRPDHAISSRQKSLYARYPITERVLRDVLYWVLEIRGAGFTISPRLAGVMERTATRHLHRQVADPALRARLTPSYQIGCKRVLLSSAFYPALQRPNVDLVTAGIETFTPQGIRDVDGVEHDADAVVFATGFDVSGNLRQLHILGRGGRSLDDVWSEQGANAHLGIMVSGFPNLFLLLGPNTGLGHTSVIFMIESQIAFVLRALHLLDRKGARAIDVRSAVQRRSVRRVQGRLAGSVWQSGCRSWYLDEFGRNYSIWPKPSPQYWLATRRVRGRDYQVSAR